MKKLAVVPFILVLAYSCGNNKNIPDVSNIRVQLDVERFDKDFFAIDTNNIEAGIDSLQEKYPHFLNDFLYNILAVPTNPDSVTQSVKLFINDYRPVYDSAQAIFASTYDTQKEIRRGLQFVKHYFPDYKLPSHVIIFIGPIEGYANVLTSSGLAVGLQLYMGKDFSGYHNDYISSVYPNYLSRRFQPEYIPVNSMKNILDDIYPGPGPDLPLVYQMVEAGKRLYVLDHFLPDTPDSLKTGYTQQQLQGCYENEAMIWSYFAQNNLLYITDPAQTKDYMDEGPKTDVLGEASPGFIGQFVGWQIVKKWMEQKENASLEQLLKTPSKEIFEEAKYKPR